jgi:hypothetical protein
MMKYYITSKLNIAQAVTDLLNEEVIDALYSNIYFVELVPESYSEKKFKVYDEMDVFKGYIRVLKDRQRNTTKYADIIEHKDGGQYAIPIVYDLSYYNVDAKVKEQALAHGSIVNNLTEDWFETEV